MRRGLLMLGLLVGWITLLCACVTPLLGIMAALLDRRHVPTGLVRIPSAGSLLLYSVTVSFVATLASLLLGVGPAALLGRPVRPKRRFSGPSVLVGLCLVPLLVPPQVYAYAWGLATAPHRLLAGALPALSGSGVWGSALRAGLISAGWLWPVVALIVAAGWRTTGRSAYALALLDTSASRAFFQAVLPSLRSHLLAAACVVFTITLVEYPIPHLSLARTYATELLLLVDASAPPGQVVWTAIPAVILVLLVLSVARFALSSVGRWGAGDEEASVEAPVAGSQRVAIVAWIVVWTLSVILPVVVMLGSLRLAAKWREAFTLFREEWLDSIGVALSAGATAVLLTIATVVWASAATGLARRGWMVRLGWVGAAVVAFGALIPGATLGIGFVNIYNRGNFPRWLYTETPVVWVFALAARYAVIPVLIAWLGLRKRWVATVEQARVDGAGLAGTVVHVLLPMLWPSLLAGGAIVAMLSLSEVVISQLVHPVGYPSISLAILGLMHYGRDDTVIVASLLIVVVGVLIAQLGSSLLTRRG